MKLVKLKNGTEEPDTVVAAITVSLRGLLNDGGGVFVFELIELCRDPSYVLFGNSGEKLAAAGLIAISPNGRVAVHESVRNIVLSVAAGDGGDMTFGSPLAE